MKLRKLVLRKDVIFSLSLFVFLSSAEAGVKKSKNVYAKDDYKIFNVSESDINRIHCDEGISFYQTSSEKYLAVTFDPNDKKRVDMFVKIKPILISRDDDPIPKAYYDGTNKDLLVRCGDTLYSLILHPVKIPSKTIYIYDKSKKNKKKKELAEKKGSLKGENLSSSKLAKKEVVEEFSYSSFKPKVEKNLDIQKAVEYEKKADSYQGTLISLISSTFKGKSDLPGYKVLKFDIQVDSYKQGGLILRKVFEGISYRVYLYSFLAYQNIEKPLREVDFAYLSEKPLAISIEDVVLNKGDMTRIAVVEASNTPFSTFVTSKIREMNKKTP